jgi:hypothetical protein
MLLAGFGCAALRQNMRGQELSYRGAWYCESAGCEEADMVQSRAGHREDTTMINEVKLQPQAALAFTAASPFETLTATVEDCKGTSAEVPAGDIAEAGAHGVGDSGARESWLVWLDPAHLGELELGSGSCAIWTVEATASWSDGASYSLRAGVEVGG